jgi:hypothetical protein
VNPNSPSAQRLIQEVQQAARAKGEQLSILMTSTETEIDAAFASVSELAAGALLVGADPFLSGRREQLVALAEFHAAEARSRAAQLTERCRWGGLNTAFDAAFAA